MYLTESYDDIQKLDREKNNNKWREEKKIRRQVSIQDIFTYENYIHIHNDIQVEGLQHTLMN